MSDRPFISDDAIARNQPARAYTDGLPWLTRASYVALAQIPAKDAPGGGVGVSSSVCKVVLWDLLYQDGRPTTLIAIANRCGLSYSRVAAIKAHLLALGLLTERRVHSGNLCVAIEYTVVVEAVARLPRPRATSGT